MNLHYVWTQSPRGCCPHLEGMHCSPRDHQPTLSSRQTWDQQLKSHFPSSKLYARQDTLPVWDFLDVNIFLKMINVLPITGGSCQICLRQGPLAGAVPCLACRCILRGRRWESGWRRKGGREVKPTALNLCRFCHESVKWRQETGYSQNAKS